MAIFLIVTIDFSGTKHPVSVWTHKEKAIKEAEHDVEYKYVKNVEVYELELDSRVSYRVFATLNE